MESLESLAQFVEIYPQVENGSIKYVFTGGTAVRLNQEFAKSEERRQITDFDLLVFGRESYPVHSFKLGQTDLDFLPNDKLRDYVNEVNLL